MLCGIFGGEVLSHICTGDAWVLESRLDWPPDIVKFNIYVLGDPKEYYRPEASRVAVYSRLGSLSPLDRLITPQEVHDFCWIRDIHRSKYVDWAAKCWKRIRNWPGTFGTRQSAHIQLANLRRRVRKPGACNAQSGKEIGANGYSSVKIGAEADEPTLEPYEASPPRVASEYEAREEPTEMDIGSGSQGLPRLEELCITGTTAQ